MPIRIKMSIDRDQSAKRSAWVLCPECSQKLGDIEYLRGVAEIRFKCRRCGKFVRCELMGVS